ncbi:hypothetical protein BASA83_002527 [Batrachochytrium salamandrivorans]|nr:hypothetical protein BASA83_002527 [Batrachochytrium salamandrivorans]
MLQHKVMPFELADPSKPGVPELWDDIIKYIPGTMSLEEARSIRLELMQERSAFADMLNEDVFENLFNLNAH